MSLRDVSKLALSLCAGTFLLAHVAVAAEPCAIRAAVETIIRIPLPTLTVAAESDAQANTCSKTVAGGFNGDGRTDYAAVLTEAAAPQPKSYIVVFLATALPYAEYQAITLLGHSSAPKRMNLEAAAPAGVKGHTMLVVKNATYSRTAYEWTASGFQVSRHDAD